MRKPISPMICIACAAALSFGASSARANTVVDLTIEEMSTRASAVVHGTVRRVDAAWDDSHTRIFTEVDIEVISYIAGRGPETVTIRQVGGRVGDQELRVAGQPRFSVGQQVVVFLEPDGSEVRDRYVVMCMAAGHFEVSFDRLTGELVLSQDTRGLTRVPGPGRQRLSRRAVARPLLLRELSQQVRSARAAGGVR